MSWFVKLVVKTCCVDGEFAVVKGVWKSRVVMLIPNLGLLPAFSYLNAIAIANFTLTEENKPNLFGVESFINECDRYNFQSLPQSYSHKSILKLIDKSALIW
ncbi:MAG TPA: hypothetical protein VK211_13005 [Kamptonema sp.]|nr:hypothetical protein [Kamptonema sp.]